MKPVSPREGRAQVVLVGPPGSDVGDLPAQFDHGGFRSEWEPSFEERQAILDGARVVLWVMGNGHPPVSLQVEGVDDVGADGGDAP